MIGSIAGDIIGSVYEHRPHKSKDFPLFHEKAGFTDDSILTIAIADALVNGKSYQETVWTYARNFPGAGYGAAFIRWFMSNTPKSYNSWGNGSGMRVSPVGFAFDSEEEVLRQATLSAEITHNHPEGIEGAQAIALAIFLARQGVSKADIRERISKEFGYNLLRTVNEIRPTYTFDVSCKGSVPEAIICFLDGDSWEDTVRNAISLGGDSDTIACMAGGIAEAYYGGVSLEIHDKVKEVLTPELWAVVEAFYEKFTISL